MQTNPEDVSSTCLSNVKKTDAVGRCYNIISYFFFLPTTCKRPTYNVSLDRALAVPGEYHILVINPHDAGKAKSGRQKLCVH